MSLEFKYFSNLSHQTQPLGSNWCWAACLSKILKGFNIKSPLGTSQCEIVRHYLNYLKIENVNNGNCNNEFYAKKHNKALDPNDLESIFSDFGVYCNKINNKSIKNKLSDYDFIKNTLKQTGAPIILRIDQNQSEHLILITGFGKIDSCNYLLESDPINKQEFYISLESFNYSSIIAAWTIDFKQELFTNFLVDDTQLINSINTYKDFANHYAETNVKDISLPSQLSNQTYWMFKTSSLIFIDENFNTTAGEDKNCLYNSFHRDSFLEHLKPIIPIEKLIPKDQPKSPQKKIL